MKSTRGTGSMARKILSRPFSNHNRGWIKSLAVVMLVVIVTNIGIVVFHFGLHNGHRPRTRSFSSPKKLESSRVHHTDLRNEEPSVNYETYRGKGSLAGDPDTDKKSMTDIRNLNEEILNSDIDTNEDKDGNKESDTDDLDIDGETLIFNRGTDGDKDSSIESITDDLNAKQEFLNSYRDNNEDTDRNENSVIDDLDTNEESINENKDRNDNPVIDDLDTNEESINENKDRNENSVIDDLDTNEESINENKDRNENSVIDDVDTNEESINEDKDRNDNSIIDDLDTNEESINEKKDRNENSIIDDLDTNEESINEKKDRNENSITGDLDTNEESINEKKDRNENSIIDDLDTNEESINEKKDRNENSIIDDLDTNEESINENKDRNENSVTGDEDTNEESINKNKDRNENSVTDDVDTNEESIKEGTDNEDTDINGKDTNELESMSDDINNNESAFNDDTDTNEEAIVDYTARKEELSKGQQDKTRNEGSPIPLILWWDPISGTQDKQVQCGKQKRQCQVTVDRSRWKEQEIMVLSFYGTTLSTHHLPIPRREGDLWALYHEESPKNLDFLFSHQTVMELFNYTATFRQHADLSFPTQWLNNVKDLISDEYVVPVSVKSEMREREGLAPVLYVQSDCRVPSDRDHYVTLLQQHVQVDSYGACINNKPFPNASSLSFQAKGSMAPMTSEDFYRFSARYKFAISIENAVCPGYITEKYWRPLHLGVVPIVFGAPNIKEFLPSDNSAFLIDDFSSVEELAKAIHYYDKHDDEYNKLINFKQTGITNPALLEHINKRPPETDQYTAHLLVEYHCMLCEKLHEAILSHESGKPIPHSVARKDHYGCDKPGKFDDMGKYVPQVAGHWHQPWLYSQATACVLRKLIEEGTHVSIQTFETMVKETQLTFDRDCLQYF